MTHTKEPTYPVTLFQAVILGPRDVLVKLRAMSLDIMPRPKQRADGRIELRAILKPEQLEHVRGRADGLANLLGEPIVAAGLVIDVFRTLYPYVESFAPALNELVDVLSPSR